MRDTMGVSVTIHIPYVPGSTSLINTSTPLAPNNTTPHTYEQLQRQVLFHYKSDKKTVSHKNILCHISKY